MVLLVLLSLLPLLDPGILVASPFPSGLLPVLLFLPLTLAQLRITLSTTVPKPALVPRGHRPMGTED